MPLVVSPHNTSFICKASKSEDKETPLPRPRLPTTGYFAEVDHKAELPPPKRVPTRFDPKRKGGRYESDFIWNQDWIATLEHEEAQEKRRLEEEEKALESTVGKISMSNKLDLNKLDVDLSQQLQTRRKTAQELIDEAMAGVPNAGGSTPRLQSTSGTASGGATRPLPPKPSAKQKALWDKNTRFSQGSSSPSALSSGQLELEKAAEAEAERVRYEEMKNELQLWAAGLTTVCFAATLTFYGKDVAASYGLGALGGLLYLRLLSRSVDGVGSGGLGGALGQPRLLIPVILVLIYNRYNAMVKEDTGITLMLLPMLTGFFTYKGAVVAKQGLDLLVDIFKSEDKGD